MSSYGHIGTMDYLACRSPARRWNPVLKLLFALTVLLLCITLNTMAVSFYTVVTMAVINIKKNRVALPEYIGLLCVPLLFILMGTIAIALDIRHEGQWCFRFTHEGLVSAAEVALRAFGAVSALYFLALSTPAGDLVRALCFLHMPSLLTELMYMMYKYIFMLLDIQMKMKTAAISRLGYTDYKTALRTFGSSGANLLILSMRRGRETYQAMESRCYAGELSFWSEEKPVKVSQSIGMAVYLLSMFVIWLMAKGGIFYG